MKPGLEPGRFEEHDFVVSVEMCPHFDGILVHRVCATWTLVHQMEVAGRRVLVPHLEAHEEGVGAHIRIDHRAPAPLGERVIVRAEVEALRRNRLVCRVEARCAGRLVAEGQFDQVILPRDVLAERLRPS